MLLYAWLIARVTRAWSHPAVVYALYWAILLFLPPIFVRMAPLHWIAVLYICVTVVAFGLPVFFYDWSESVAIARARNGAGRKCYAPLLPLFYVLQIATIVFVVINLSIQGFGLSEVILRPIDSANRYMSLRYSGRVATNIFQQGSVVFNYIAVIFAGLLVEQQKSKRTIVTILLFAIAPSLMHMVFYADKGTLFLAGAYFYGAVIVARVARGDLSLINAATIKHSIGAAVALAPFLLFAMVSRKSELPLAFTINSYAFGHLFAFSDWFSDYLRVGSSIQEYANPTFPSWGYWTFAAVGKFIIPGYQLPPGYWAEYFQTPDVKTNIYTMYRGLIYDFGIAGSIAFMAAFGAVASAAYDKMLRYEMPAISQSFYVLFFAFSYMSYAISLLIWKSPYVTFIVTAVVLSIIRRCMSGAGLRLESLDRSRD